MFNLKKFAEKEAESYAQRLDERNKADGSTNDGLSNTDKMLDKVRDNKDLIDTTEVQLDGGREKVAEQTTEAQLNSATGSMIPHRNDNNESLPVKPLDVLNAAQEEERLKAYKEAEKGLVGEDDTNFWDEYVNKALGDAPSQLANNPDRFSKLTTDVADLSERAKVKDMVMASLKDADAMLFAIHFKAAKEKRELSAEEQKLVDGITSDKVRVLAEAVGTVKEADVRPQYDAGQLAAMIDEKEKLLRQTSPMSPEYDRIKGELETLIHASRKMVGQTGLNGPNAPGQFRAQNGNTGVVTPPTVQPFAR